MKLNNISTHDLIVSLQNCSQQAREPMVTELLRRTEKKIILPIGFGKGSVHKSPVDALFLLAIGMMGHRSDLLEEDRREQITAPGMTVVSKIYAALLLERYATALNIIIFQMMDDERLRGSNISGILELAEKHDLYLPDELSGLAMCLLAVQLKNKEGE